MSPVEDDEIGTAILEAQSLLEMSRSCSNLGAVYAAQAQASALIGIAHLLADIADSLDVR